MNSQDKSPKLLEEKDNTLPIILTGLFSSYVCICICMCTALLLIGLYSNNKVSPTTNLVEPSPIATLSLPPCPAIPTGWVEVMNDKFGPNVNMWPVGKDTDAYADTEMEIRYGALRWSLNAHQGFYAYEEPQFISSQHNFYLQTNVRQTNSPLDSNYGVTFRGNGWNQYYFAINDVGKVLVYKHADNEDHLWENLFWTDSAIAQPGKYNELIVIAQDSHFTFCVNQQMVGEMTDDSYISGYVGIGANLHQAKEETLIEYDNYTVYAPKQ
jgi:hypothetical protein